MIISGKPPRRHHALFVLLGFVPGGAERSLFVLASQLTNQMPVSFATLRQGGEMYLDNLTDYSPPRVSLWGRAGVFFRLPWIVWRTRPAVVLSTLWDINLLVLMLCRLFFLPRVRVVVREAAMLNAILRETAMPRFWRFLCRRFYGHADRIVVMTHAMKRALCADLALSEDRVRVIPNAVDLRRLPPTLSIGMGHETSHPTRLITMGRLVPQKGFDVLIRGMAEAAKVRLNVSLSIYGNGPERENLLKLIRSLGLTDVVALYDYSADPFSLLLQSDIYVLSSRYEGMSNALLEALCCGVPALAVVENNGADEVIVDGLNGFLVPRCAVGDVSVGIGRAVAGHRQLDRHRIAQEARSLFSVEQQVERYREMFCELGVETMSRG